MNCEKIRTLFNKNGVVHFTMYGLPYIVEKSDNGANICPNTTPKQMKQYNSIDSVLKYYTIYNESIEENDDRIRDIY